MEIEIDISRKGFYTSIIILLVIMISVTVAIATPDSTHSADSVSLKIGDGYKTLQQAFDDYYADGNSFSLISKMSYDQAIIGIPAYYDYEENKEIIYGADDCLFLTNMEDGHHGETDTSNFNDLNDWHDNAYAGFQAYVRPFQEDENTYILRCVYGDAANEEWYDNPAWMPLGIDYRCRVSIFCKHRY